MAPPICLFRDQPKMLVNAIYYFSYITGVKVNSNILAKEKVNLNIQ